MAEALLKSLKISFSRFGNEPVVFMVIGFIGLFID
jgi:hypothetical protein